MPNLVPVGSLRFSQYDLLLQAALSGQGVALGRSPLIDDAVARGELVMPFPRRYDSRRGYFALSGSRAAGRVEVQQFLAWLRGEAAGGADTAEPGASDSMKPAGRRAASPRCHRGVCRSKKGPLRAGCA